MLTKAFFSLRDFVTEDILPHMLTKAFFPFATLLQKDIFHILLPKQISSLGTGSGPVPTSPPPLFGTRFWQETNRKIAPEELCRSKFPYNRARFGGSPRTKSLLLYSRSRRHRLWPGLATTRLSVPTLPSRAHLQD